MNRYSVDRIEEGFAIIEYDSNFFEVNTDNLPTGVCEGDILCKNSDGRYEIDRTETRNRKARLNNIQNNLFEK